MRSDVRIETERLLLRRFLSSDGVDLAEILTDAEVCYYEPYEVFTQESAIEEAGKLAASDSFFAVILKRERKCIGKLYFHDEKHFDTWELGYTFHRHYWGRGYASEAVQALMRYAFIELRVRRIFAEADVQNVHSCRLLERLGFRKEGIFLQSAAYQSSPDGEPIFSDYCSYAMLREEYKGGQL